MHKIYTAEERSLIILSAFYGWCENHSLNKNQLQAFLNNEKLFIWFLREVRNKDETFLIDHQSYIERVSRTTLKQSYENSLKTINNYPKAIINEIKKQARTTHTETRILQHSVIWN